MAGQLHAADLRFFWIEAGEEVERRQYHDCVDCPFVQVALWHGGRLVTAARPPGDAVDVHRMRMLLESNGVGEPPNLEGVPQPGPPPPDGRWLCPACWCFVPRPVGHEPDPAEEPCAVCACPADIHGDYPFSTGCGWAAAETMGEMVRMIHCPCDGYLPPGTPPLKGPPNSQGAWREHSPCLYHWKWGFHPGRARQSRQAKRDLPVKMAARTPSLPFLSALPERAGNRPPGCVSERHVAAWYVGSDGSRGCRTCHP